MKFLFGQHSCVVLQQMRLRQRLLLQVCAVEGPVHKHADGSSLLALPLLLYCCYTTAVLLLVLQCIQAQVLL